MKLVEREITNNKFLIDPFDADDSECSLDGFNVFICISLEHIEKDLEIISKLKPGTIVSICSPNFDCDGHVRHFESMEVFRSRYEHVINVRMQSTFQKTRFKQKYIITGERV